ncbi:NAD(P)-dependent alcohol dehydrogenase [Streptomyces polyrhachis]|uniref:alcohol dehydrogenase (NADP(+)) n=1 Tax=Streptomyces polyrhachis TaxID=1282885 RepID=A0ABW2GHX6_9ACTN
MHTPADPPPAEAPTDAPAEAPVKVTAYAAPFAGAPLERTVIEHRPLGGRDVLIEVAYCGICHSDIHQSRDEWGGALYPMVPGHEIAGTVTAAGPEASLHRVGDRVGVGCFVDSCRTCANCRAGLQQYCLDTPVGTYNDTDYEGRPTYGGYATHLVVDERYVLRVPDAVDLREAAPLLCAGVTPYSVLRHWQAGPGTRFAVVGLGGVGHMAVQLAHALGARTTVLSHTPAKEEDALRLGADHFHTTADPAVFEALAGSFDLILHTVPVTVPLDACLALLRTDGTLVTVGSPPLEQPMNVFSLINLRKSMAGSLAGGIGQTQELLDFCAQHGLRPRIEVIPATRINEAYERVVAGDVRYRFVIDGSTYGTD